MKTPLTAPALFAALAFSLAAPVTAHVDPGSSRAGTMLTSVPGTIWDLGRESGGQLLFCTTQGDVGLISTAGGAITYLATPADFPQPLRAVAETPNGDIAVIDTLGDIWVLPGRSTPPVRIYQDQYLIGDPSDLVVDLSGNYLVTSETPSAGQLGIGWISSNGNRWSYYLVEHLPISMAADPISGGLFLADEKNGGDLRLIDTSDETHPAYMLDGTTNFGFSGPLKDGDIAVEADGDALFVTNQRLYRYDRALGTTSILSSGYAQVRSVAIAASSGNVLSASGWSAYLTEFANPSIIHEVGNVGAPASLIVAPTGLVPNRGLQVSFFGNLRVYELSVDAAGNLLVGGDLFGADPSVRRVNLANGNLIPIADDTDGITGRIEGIATREDGLIYAMTDTGVIHTIRENPLQVGTHYNDAANVIDSGWDMALGVDGTLYVANREQTIVGEVIAVDPSGASATPLVTLKEARGVAASPATGGLYVAEWQNIGFHGTIDHLNLQNNNLVTLPGATMLNYSNAEWGDGDLVVDVEGNIYTCSEDDWRVIKYDPAKQRYSTIGSSYVNHPSGVAIARSRAGSGSTTGWSLYVSEFDYLWELPSVPPPAMRIVGCSSQAVASVRNGSGANLLAYTQVSPGIVGGTWETAVDLSGTGGHVSFVAVSLTGATSGIFLPFGELLIAPPVILDSGFGEHAIDVPNQCVLVGFTFATQAASFTIGSGAIEFLNALDVTFGTF